MLVFTKKQVCPSYFFFSVVGESVFYTIQKTLTPCPHMGDTNDVHLGNICILLGLLDYHNENNNVPTGICLFLFYNQTSLCCNDLTVATLTITHDIHKDVSWHCYFNTDRISYGITIYFRNIIENFKRSSAIASGYQKHKVIL